MALYINGRFLTQKITGVQRFAIEVVKQLDKMNLDEKIIILHPKGVIQKLNLKNIELKQIGKMNGHIWEQIELPLFMFRHKKDKLISMCNIAPILFPGYVVLHDIAFKTNSEHLDWKFKCLYRFITRLNIKRYKHIFTVSDFSRKEIISEYKINDNKISITYDSAEHILELKPDINILEKLNLKNKQFYFSLGSKSPHKNHKYIEECAINNPELLFVVTGKNNADIFKDDEKKQIDNLIYTGYLSDSEIVTMYKNCKAFIFPSLYEGFGIPPLEALTCGCNKIILSDIPVLNEIYTDIAFFVKTDAYNHVEFLEVIENDNKELNKDFLNRYSWKKTCEKLIRIINKG